jgi:hypothetical protein
LLIAHFWTTGPVAEGLSDVLNSLALLYIDCFERIRTTEFLDLVGFVKDTVVPCGDSPALFTELCIFCCRGVCDKLGESWTLPDDAIQKALTKIVLKLIEACWWTVSLSLIEWLCALPLNVLVPDHFKIISHLAGKFPIQRVVEICEYLPDMSDECCPAAVKAIATLIQTRPELLDDLPFDSILRSFGKHGDCIPPLMSILCAYFRTERSVEAIVPILSVLVRKFRAWANYPQVYKMVVMLARRYRLLDQVCHELFSVVAEELGRPSERASSVIAFIMSNNPFGPGYQEALYSLYYEKTDDI